MELIEFGGKFDPNRFFFLYFFAEVDPRYVFGRLD